MIRTSDPSHIRFGAPGKSPSTVQRSVVSIRKRRVTGLRVTKKEETVEFIREVQNALSVREEEGTVTRKGNL